MGGYFKFKKNCVNFGSSIDEWMYYINVNMAHKTFV
jgi:hypothetical protein